MSFKSTMATAALALVAAGTTAHAGSILALADNGEVYRVNTATAVATLFDVVTDLPGSPALDSPNGLGYNGSLFYTDFGPNGPGDTRELHRKTPPAAPGGTDEKLTDITVENFANAAGTAEGDTYYYVDNGGNFGTVTGINGAAGTQSNSTEKLFGGGVHGDLDIIGGTAWHSYSQNGSAFVSTFGVSDIGAGFTATVAQDDLFSGLAFHGSSLFGIVAGAGLNELWNIDPLTLNASLVGGITGLSGSQRVLTDAAPIPLPASALLLLGGLGGVAGLRSIRRKAG